MFKNTGSLIAPGTATILCSNCGRGIDGTLGLTFCYDCIKLTTDIAKDVPKEAHVNFCRNCERFLMPPTRWLYCAPESRELLALLLKRLRGLDKIRLVDAKFLWTEPHSRRIKVKLSVQGEAQNVIVQQDFEVEYVVVATQCPDCAKSFTVHTWAAALQIRQKVPHKRTFFYLEQMILRYNAHLDTVNIKESRDGIDFYYSHQNHALKMIQFLANVVPIRYGKSEELISQDSHTGKNSYKFSFSVEIVPLCREDLVILPRPVAHHLSNISQLVIVSRVNNSIQFLDPDTLQTADLPAEGFWLQPFKSLLNSAQLTEFFVEDIEPLGPVRGKQALAQAIVRRTADLNVSYVIKTHLGGILKPGDLAMGYYLPNTNFNNDHWDEFCQRRVNDVVDVVLVKKHYPNRRKAEKRNWRLKRMAKEHNAEQTAADIDRVEQDYEVFLQQIEEDPELQDAFQLYKAPNSQNPGKQKTYAKGMDLDAAASDELEDGPDVDVDKLLDDLDDMTLEE